LKPVRFKYNDGSSDRYHTGLIAQDLEAAIDEAGLATQEVAAYVKHNTSEGDEHSGIRYEELIALLISQVQDLKGRVAELEQKLKGESV
jgi:outer membrane murein-binding lipoprotein Lpp